jgi:hypothetical protein
VLVVTTVSRVRHRMPVPGAAGVAVVRAAARAGVRFALRVAVVRRMAGRGAAVRVDVAVPPSAWRRASASRSSWASRGVSAGRTAELVRGAAAGREGTAEPDDGRRAGVRVAGTASSPRLRRLLA